MANYVCMYVPFDTKKYFFSHSSVPVQKFSFATLSMSNTIEKESERKREKVLFVCLTAKVCVHKRVCLYFQFGIVKTKQKKFYKQNC